MGRWMLIRLLTCMRGCVEDFFVSVLFPLALCPAFFFFSLVFPSFQSMLHSSDFRHRRHHSPLQYECSLLDPPPRSR